MSELPLTRTGKVQRNALPAPQPVRLGPVSFENGPRTALERQILEMWQSVLHTDGIGIDHDFFKVGGHSLLAVRLMGEINSFFGTHLPLATIFRTPTVQSLAEAVRTSGEATARPPGLVRPQPGETGQPVFWAPSIGSVERFIECNNLARLLRGEYAFYGFDPAPQFKEIQSLAQHCTELIRAEQPHGPYFLAGYCQCGHVAYEIATRLEREGEEVRLLAIIDSSARDMGASIRHRLYWVRDAFRGNPRVVLRRLRSFARRTFLPASGVDVTGIVVDERFVAHNHAIRQHKPPAFSGVVTLFRSQEWLSRLPQAPKLGWDALARDVRVYPVACNHLALLSNPEALQLIIETMKEALESKPS